MSASSMPGWSRRHRVSLTLALLAACVLVLPLAACGGAGAGGGTSSTPTSPTASSTVTPAPFTVTAVDLAVKPASIAGDTCGSSATFTYTATFHIPANTTGGVIQFNYTLNNGRSQTPGSVTVPAGATTKTFTFTSSGALPPDHTYPGNAIVMVTSPNSVQSPAVTPTGQCTAPAAFHVTSVVMSVNPSSIAGKACGTSLTVTYTATFHLASNGPGGTIHFDYTTNNGRGSTPATITVPAGQTTITYSFTWSGALPADHTYPAPGGVMVTSPNVINSSLVGPAGACS